MNCEVLYQLKVETKRRGIDGATVLYSVSDLRLKQKFFFERFSAIAVER